MICHESFPGHQAFSAIREQQFRAGSLPIEGSVYFGNTPISPIVEGLCEMGQTILGLMETIDDQIYHEYNRLTFAVSTNLAFACHSDGMDKETAVRLLMDSTHVSRVFAEKRYHFWMDPLWCTSFPHYWYGTEFMRESYTKMENHRADFFRMIYMEPHTVRTLKQRIQSYLDR